jgi:formate hydrogenlyase subunit 6/NADH:ubiquinone oxidoreductase subunit I
VAWDIYPYVPSPTTVDIRFDTRVPGEDKYPRDPRPATVEVRSTAVITSTPCTVGRGCDSSCPKTFIVFGITISI